MRVFHDGDCVCGSCGFDELVWQREATDSLISDVRSIFETTDCVELERSAPLVWRSLMLVLEATLDRYSHRSSPPR